MKSKYIAIAAIFAGMTLQLPACSDDKRGGAPFPIEDETPGGEEQQPPVSSDFRELYRPQIHFTPAQNWMNDPNGMVYSNGVYHLFFQHNPSGNDWGNLSWGHATSTDLIHWEHQPVALRPDNLGYIFSGSAVVDEKNVAGFGAGAIIAFYTSADEFQQQSMAYSTDNGKTFTKYEGNPVIPSTSKDFRDPKVCYHAESGKWIMSLAKGWEYGIEFWGSSDLKSWSRLSEFKTPVDRCNKGQWECPDLLRMTLDGVEKWVLLVSVNPGGPSGGSGTMYFVGDFDGTTFTPDTLDYPMWLDYGTDNYAGVTWSNTGNRQVLIGWMNNWNYVGATPTTPWRSAMTLPRELKLISCDGKPLLANTVVKEIDGIADAWTEVGNESVLPVKDAYQIRLTFDLTKNSSFTLSNEAGEKAEFVVNGSSRKLLFKRNASTGNVSFEGRFSLPGIGAPLNVEGDRMTLDIFVDASSIEAFTENGSSAMTALVFPKSIYNRVSAPEATSVEVRNLNRIW